MVETFNNCADLFNQMLYINASCVKTNDFKKNKIPISCVYFLTIFDEINDSDVNKMFRYMNDDTRLIEYPFNKIANIDYSLMLEMDQFYNINLNDCYPLKKLSNNIDYFINIVKESDGKIVFVLDIDYLIEIINVPNNKFKHLFYHVLDLIIFKLCAENIPEILKIFILDKKNIIKNTSNILYSQLDLCLNKTNKTNKANKTKPDSIINKIIEDNNTESKNIFKLYKCVDDSKKSLEKTIGSINPIDENIYWDLVEDENEITEYLGKIKSPYDDTFYNLMTISGKHCFVKNVYINELINTNIFCSEINSSVTINPIKRLFTYI